MEASEYIDKVKAERNQLRVENERLLALNTAMRKVLTEIEVVRDPDDETMWIKFSPGRSSFAGMTCVMVEKDPMRDLIIGSWERLRQQAVMPESHVNTATEDRIKAAYTDFASRTATASESGAG